MKSLRRIKLIKLPTKKVKGGYKLSNIRALFYGPWKIGKSTLCSKFNEAVFIGTEKGLEGLEVYKIYIRNWEEYLEAIDKLLNTKHNFKTIITDTVDNAVKFCTIHSCKKYKVDHPSDMKWGKGWDLFQREFETPMLQLSVSDFGVIFTSHERENEIVKGANKYTKFGPSFPNQARKIIGPFVDIIGHCYVDEDVDENGNTKERRYIEFEPTPYVEAGDRTGLLPARIPLRYYSFKKYFPKEEE